MPKRRIFIDSSVLIRGLAYEESNSALIIKMVSRNELIGVINPKVVVEVLHVLRNLKNKDFASLSFSFMHSTFEIVPEEQYVEEMGRLRGTIKEKDPEHLATARASGIDIIAYDRDFDGLKEYFTPKEFLVSMNLRAYNTVY